MVPWGTNIWNNPHVIRQHMAFPRCQPAYRHGLRKTSDAKEPPAGCLTLGSQIWKEIRSVTCLVEEGNMLQKPHKCIGSFSGNWEANIKDLWLSLSLLFEKIFWRFCPTILEVIWTPRAKQQPRHNRLSCCVILPSISLLAFASIPSAPKCFFSEI